MRIKTTFLIFLLVAAPLPAGTITSFWIGGTGDWTNPAQWSPAGVPNNGAQTFLASINSGGVDVANILTQNIFLNGITIGPQGTVHANDQGLVLGSPASPSTLLTNAGAINLTNAANLTLDYSAGAPAFNSGTISVGDESAIYITAPTAGAGTLNNTGTIALQANPNGSQIYLYGDGAAFTLNGGGNLTLSDNPANLITGSFGTETLVSDNKISGAGTIAMLANFTNNGTVIANGTNPLVFNMDTGTAGVTGTIVNNGSIQAASGGSLILQGSADLQVTNNGAITLNAQGGQVSGLLYNDNNTGSALNLSGSGGLTLSDNGNNLVAGVNGDETLVNGLGHTISGAGTISNFQAIENAGTIAASGTNPLILSLNNGPTPHGDLVNSGTLQVNDGSTLVVRAAGALINNSGTIALNASNGLSTLLLDDGGLGGQFTISSAAGSSGAILLTDNPGNRILGTGGSESLLLGNGQQLSGAGTIANFNLLSNQGAIVASGTNPLILSLGGQAGGGSLINTGSLQVNDGSTMQFRSSGVDIDNEGVIALNAAKGTSTLSFDDSKTGAQFSITNTVAGGGKITLSDNSGNRIVGVNGTESLFLGNGQQVSGAGTIGNFSFLDNHGTITANGANPLIFGLSNTANPFGNMENAGTINVNDGSTIRIDSGAWVNNVGTINLNAGAHTSTLAFNNNQPILLGSATAAGQLIMSDNSGNRIVGVTGAETLVNNTAHTIQGAGTIANFGGGFVNNGVMMANGVNPLIVDIGAATARGNAGLTSGGIIEIANGSTLQILSASGGTVLTTGTGEVFLGATPAGTSTLSFNDQGKGQTFTLNSTGGNATVVMSIGGNRITGVNGDETLINGANSTILGQGTISNFAQFVNNGTLATGGGVLEVQAPLANWNGATGTLTGGTYVADGGVLKLNSLGAQTITNLAGASVSIQGAGTIAGSGAANALAGLATVTNSSILMNSGSALAVTPTGGSLTLTNSNVTSLGASLAINGSVSVDAQSTLSSLSGGSISIGGSLFTDASSQIVVGNSTSLAASDFVNAGSLVINAAGTAAFKGTVSNSGTVIVTAGADLSVLKSPFLAFGTNIYTQTDGNTKVLAGGVLNAATVDLDGGTMGGGGTIAANVVVNGGTLVPGDPTTTHIDGDLTVDANGEIVLDIDGILAGAYDSLDIDGDLHLDGGTLDIVFQNGFLPQLGDSWDLLSFTGAEDGLGFDRILFENAGDVQFASALNDGNFVLEAASGTTGVPEPSMLPILLILLVAFALRRVCRADAKTTCRR
ncbi:MAG TPA: PEP-CTERM sorting domain-containing protein [Bryobacteraceae bacterium]|jgi:hypothetical protein|nr:PEP-CTERM sorting domain-containing protein [Bryobacteraceae bacterium]